MSCLVATGEGHDQLIESSSRPQTLHGRTVAANQGLMIPTPSADRLHASKELLAAMLLELAPASHALSRSRKEAKVYYDTCSTVAHEQ